MSERTLKLLLIAVACLVLVYLGFALFESGGSTLREDGALADALAVAPEDVQDVRFIDGGDTVRLTRADGRWRVAGHPVDSASLARFWDGVRGAVVRDVVATNPANHARLGVADTSAIRLVLALTGGEEREILVGDAGPGFGTAYARLPGEDRVYLVRGDLRNPATRGVDQWRDKVFVRVDTAAVRRVEIERDGGRYALVRGDDGWTLDDGAPADSAAVQDLLGELRRLQATGFAADSVAAPEPSRAILALGAAADTLAHVRLADADAGQLLATVPGDDTLYRFSSYRADRLTPTRDEVEADGGP